MGKVRMADIAKEVGVSAVTVHNALTGNKGVSDEMRQKIQKVADEMGCTEAPPYATYNFLLPDISGLRNKYVPDIPPELIPLSTCFSPYPDGKFSCLH